MTVLAVVPHPDDESYAMAAALTLCAREGLDVHLLCLTRGEAGVDRAGRRTGTELGAARAGELEASCAALGLPPPTVLGLPDGALEAEPGGPVIDAIRDFGARVVITLGTDGVYGHRDHLATTRWVTEAGPDRVLHAAFPRGLFQPMYRRLRNRRFPGVVPGLCPEDFGCARSNAHWVVDVGPFGSAKRASMAAHESQSGGRAEGLLPIDIAPLLREEWFVVAGGPPMPAGATLPTDGLS